VSYALSGYFETSAAHSKNELLQCVFNLAAIKFGQIAGLLIPGERTIREDVYGQRIDFTLMAQGPSATVADGTPDYTTGLQTFAVRPPDVDGNSMLINPYGQTDSRSSGVVAGTPQDYDATTFKGDYRFPTLSVPQGTVA
jgi:hypothetical protein